jgi:WD40 repeat protein
MAARLNQPNEFDAALGDRRDDNQVEFDQAVLGGLAGIQQQVFNPGLAIALRTTALARAMDYGEAGLALVVDLLRDRQAAKYGEPLRRAAYELVKACPDAKTRQLIQAYNPYQFFSCLQVLDPAEGSADFPKAPMIATIFTPDQRRIISGSEDGWLRQWDCQSLSCIESWRSTTAKLTAIAFAPQAQLANHLIATGTDSGAINVWRCDPGSEIGQLSGHSDRIAALVLTDHLLISSSRDGTTLVWDWQSQAVIYELTGHGYPVAAIGNGGNLIATGSRDAIKIWDLRTGQIVRHLNGNYPIAALAFCPDQNFLIVASKDKTIKVWDIWRKRIVRTLRGHTSTVDCLAMSKDGLVLVSAGRDRTVKIWDWRSGRLLRSLGDGLLAQARHGTDIEAVAISADGSAIVSASRDGTLRLWGMGAIA